ncbi:penicillin-binding protein 1A [Pontibacterium granulatum]|uniref:penicillin-binding protein 1A n=1 Tax=Pontibacterium granulatum TaxID=2036029 RepID=UPI00249BB343|nr:penicillin-binding protein 1A [Pontibacterium granulatum]MDI3324690.1 penicillin-binding protein 1A [Pontibacterium granulatum]
MRVIKKLFKYLAILGFVGVIIGAAAGFLAYKHFSADLPEVSTLRDVKFQTPLRIYSADEKLIAEYGEKKRTPVTYDQIPPQFVNALLAAEDSRFFEHMGIDIKGLARAAVQLATTGSIKSGGSTITMQLAKNFFLTRERTFTRKFREILLALRIEQELSKEDIFELYVNKIYLGHRSYGIQAAANTYYGENLDQLSIAQLAMIAGLPKAPSANNPISNPDRALTRRNWILGRMHSLSLINDQEYEEARAEELTAKRHGADIEVDAQYIAEMVRSDLYEKYGDDLYTEGYRVFTTVKSDLQATANAALQTGLLSYTERHGYRGPEKQFTDAELQDEEQLLKTLVKIGNVSDIEPAVVVALQEKSIEVLRKSGERATLNWDQINWAREYKSANRMGSTLKKAADAFNVGDVVRIQLRTAEAEKDKKKPTDTEQPQQVWHLTQIPEVQGGLISVNPNDGAIVSLVGGFNFHHNKFNRVTQAIRQPGSNIKPFIYTAALANGFTPATLINDAPVVFHDDQLEANWRPENYSKKFYGPTRLREALYKSRNLVSIRILRQIGVSNTVQYLENFGFAKDKLPHNLSLSLGSADMTPLQVVRGYATLANGGYGIEPYFIQRIEDSEGNVIFEAKPATICKNCQYVDPEQPPAVIPQGLQVTNLPLAERKVDEQSAYLIYNMMQDVIKRGTGRRALVLQRNDLAGKTGTTNDQKDAWFSGFNRNLTTTVWVGFDQPETLGRREFGGTAALPIWIDYMRVALKDQPESAPLPPEGIVSVKIDPKTGLLANPGQKGALFEYFREDDAPTEMAAQAGSSQSGNGGATEDIF